MGNTMSTKATDFYSWLQRARKQAERFASEEEREALRWIRRHMPEEAARWDRLALHHD